MVFTTIVGLDIFFFILVASLTLFCVWAFRRKPGVETPHIAHNMFLELVWSIIPTFIVLGIFFLGAYGFMNNAVAPGNAMEIQVTAQKWSWAFEYPDGSKWVQKIQIPVGKPVKFVITSVDVLHDFYIPAMRVKMDAVPNRYTEVWFTPDKIGEYHVPCAEYCGKSHSDMWAKINVVDQKTYENWLINGPPEWDKLLKENPVAFGKEVYENAGCNNCHSVDGSKNQGPTWKGMWGREAKWTDGQSYKVDRNYILESISNPGKHVVAGYENVMPSFEGLIRDKQMTALLKYMESLK